jgi:hypothetical protein
MAAMRKLRALVLVLASSTFPAAGCMDVEQALTVERDLSGTGRLTMKIDLEPVVAAMAEMQRSMAGQEGPPTAAELERARQELLSSGEMMTSEKFEEERAAMARQLPEGVKLLDATFQEDGLRLAATMTLAFDHVSRLTQMRSAQGASGAQGAPAAGTSTPFGGLQVTDEGRTLLLTTPLQNSPLGAQGAAMPMTEDPAAAKQLEDLFKGLRIAFTITSPLQVLEHSAHRQEGQTLRWEYDLQTIQRLTPEQAQQGIRVRFAK